MTTPDPFEHLDAAYVFGALDAAEAAEYERHLKTCSACNASVIEARALTTLLAGISVDEIEAEVPETLLPGLLRKASVSRRRQRWLTAGLAGVAAACLMTLAVVAWPAPSHAPTGRTVAMTAVVQSPVTASVQLIKTSSGTTIRVHCTYAGGEGPDVEYGLVVVDKQHHKTPLSSWVISPGEDAWYPATTALQENQISQVDVTYQGKAILTATI